MKKNYLFLLVMLMVLNMSAIAQPATFSYTGTPQTWTVPAGVTSILFQATGAMGGLNSTESSTTCSATLPDRQGYGACVSGTLAVTPGQVLNIFVGGRGTDGVKTLSCTSTAGVGGYNGGGNGAVGYGPYGGGGGGGESDIRIGGVAVSDIVVVAAGGGGAGGNYYNETDYERGGDGGALTGEDGYGDNIPGATGGATGGGPLSGGLPGSYVGWTTGSPGLQTIGGAAGVPSGGGGGGGGWWGGGGGCWGGGGGGSSYTDATLCTSVSHIRGCNSTTDGSVSLCPTNPGVIIGVKPLCSGKTLTLTESVFGGVWTSTNPAIATIGSSSGIVTGIKGGTVSIIYTIPCASVSVAVTLIVSQSPKPITGTDSVCVGKIVLLNDSTIGGVWSSSDTTLARITSTGIVAGIYPGTPTITYTILPGGCVSVLPLKVDGIAGPTKVCTGSTVTLVASNGGGIWTSSDTTVATIDTSGVVTGISIGTSVISYSSTACPNGIVMTVNPIAPVLGADSVCVDGSAYFTDIVGVGSWYSSDTSIAIVSTGPGLVSGVSAGTALISFVSPAGCMAKTSVNIIPLPKIITGILHVCPGTSTTVADSTSGGVWSSNNTSVATVGATGVVTGVNADTTSVFYTVRPGCTISATVKVNPLPMPITGRDTVCPGIIDTLHDASPGGVWASSTPVVDTIIDSNGILTTRLSGTGIVSYTLPTGCTISKSLDVYPVPTPVITYNKFTNTFYAPTGYPHYQWYDSISGKIPFANSPSLAGIYTQWYYVVITDTNGCLSSSAIDHFNLDITRVNNITSTVIRIYPNPVTGIVYIESPVNVRAVINTIDGKTVLDQADAKELDISNFAGGVYLITLYDDDKKVLTTRKLIKE